MAMHMSLRLAWHDHGWNGHICENPCNNPYCVGAHSYPGDLIATKRDLELEKNHCGESAGKYPCQIACGLSINAFGKETVQTRVDPPDWWGDGNADPVTLTLPPATACTWCYEAMYKKDVSPEAGSTQTYDYNKRFNNAKEYFEQFDEGKSLVFYYAGYSNPFSEGEEENYVIVGVSRLKKIDSFHFYENTTEDIKRKYGGGFAWQKPVTSKYPEEGFCIPYWKYLHDDELAERLAIKPLNRTPFKYGSREVTNDDAIEVIHQMLETIDVLIEIGDDAEDWSKRKDWLSSVLNELWKARGPFPGMGSVLEALQLPELIKPFLDITNDAGRKDFYRQLEDLLNGDSNTIAGVEYSDKDLKIVRRQFQMKEDEEKDLLLHLLPRFDLTAKQVRGIISENREDVSITASVSELVENPYIIFEQYVGEDSDDTIPFYKIDNGIIPSPEYGLEEIIDAGSTERLRALCVDELNRIPAHSFGKAEALLKSINARLDRMPEWKRYVYSLKNFNVEKNILNGGLFMRQDENKNLYLYIRSVYEDERTVEEVFRSLADRTDIELKIPISPEKFKKNLKNENSKLLDKEETAEKYEFILDRQAEVCMQIFRKPICVLSGAAGTGKTTVIKAILDNIERVHGAGTSFLLMAPTGKAAERIKVQTGKPSSTIHSFLAKNGWLNKNMTMKRSGGKKSQDVNTLILDECSMIDLNLFATLVRAINWNSVQRLILVGDPNQLPPIGRGKVFADAIEWLKNSEEYAESVGVLTENIRQLVNTAEGNGTGILDLANVFIQEKQTAGDDTDAATRHKLEKETIFTKVLEHGNDDVDKDLSVYFWQEQENLEKLLKDRLVTDMQALTGKSAETERELHDLWTEAIKDAPERFQIISPYRGEFYGTMSINTFMQSTFNGYWSRRLSVDGIGLYDKVIQIRNRPASDKAYVYDWSTRKPGRQEVYNGEIATVSPMAYEAKKISWMTNIQHFQCKFSGKTRLNYSYNYGKFLGKDDKGYWIPDQNVTDNLELAYAISVHKSQGSEFDYVYIIIPKRESHLLTMELLYTALTRAQRHVTVFLQQDISTLTTMSHVEKSAVRKINSSVFEFKPLPDELLYSGDWYKEEKKLATLSEYFVRSKSEVIIANMLVSEEVPFVYEEPLYAKDGTMYLPDFTVKFRGETYYWEHVGRLDLPGYKAHWEKKEKWYEKNFPGKLLTTYEGKDLSTAAMEIIQSHK